MKRIWTRIFKWSWDHDHQRLAQLLVNVAPLAWVVPAIRAIAHVTYCSVQIEPIAGTAISYEVGRYQLSSNNAPVNSVIKDLKNAIKRFTERQNSKREVQPPGGEQERSSNDGRLSPKRVRVGRAVQVRLTKARTLRPSKARLHPELFPDSFAAGSLIIPRIGYQSPPWEPVSITARQFSDNPALRLETEDDS